MFCTKESVKSLYFVFQSLQNNAVITNRIFNFNCYLDNGLTRFCWGLRHREPSAIKITIVLSLLVFLSRTGTSPGWQMHAWRRSRQDQQRVTRAMRNHNFPQTNGIVAVICNGGVIF